ncbi:hypothetical protein [Bacillus sp. PK3_68]|nr:hypothetical protein [Bacillus sp. PK3_68]
MFIIPTSGGKERRIAKRSVFYKKIEKKLEEKYADTVNGQQAG